MLLMMGGVSPETCWASYKYGKINFDILLHLVGFFCMNFTMMHGSTTHQVSIDLRASEGAKIDIVRHKHLPALAWIPTLCATLIHLQCIETNELQLQFCKWQPYIPLLIPTWYTIFYIYYIKLSSSTCFERHPPIFRRSMMLIVQSSLSKCTRRPPA